MIRKQTIHPLILLLYFISLLCWIVLYRHPITILIFFLCVGIVYMYLYGWKIRQITSYIVLLLFITITNPLFVREGADILYQNSFLIITKQALLYGIMFGLVMISVLLLYQIMQQFITSEHILFVFSKRFKILGLLLMLVFRMLPKCKRKINEIRDVQNLLHHRGHTLLALLKGLKDQFLVLFTWIFEASLVMYESMKARGYQNQRTHYHIFRWSRSDIYFLILILVLNVGLIFGYQHYQNFYYYPMMAPITFYYGDILFWLVIMVISFIPLLWKGENNVKNR